MITIAMLVIVAAVLAIYGLGLVQRNSKNLKEVLTLRGSGATFLQPQLEAWIQEFMKKYDDIVIEYQGIGSGAGQEQFFKGLTDFCGSDPPSAMKNG